MPVGGIYCSESGSAGGQTEGVGFVSVFLLQMRCVFRIYLGSAGGQVGYEFR